MNSKSLLHPPPCPHCKSCQRIKTGKQSGIQRYRCKKCLKYYRETNGTTIYRIHKKALVENYISCMLQGYSLRKTAGEVGISLVTAFKWRHKFLHVIKQTDVKLQETSAVIAEVMTGYSEKGSRMINKNNVKAKSVFSAITFDHVGQVRLYKPNSFYDIVQITRQNLNVSYIGEIRNSPRMLKTGKVAIQDNKYLKQLSFLKLKIKLWIQRFRGVATKYLQHYWNWFVQMEVFEQSKSPLQIMFQKCLWSAESYTT